MILIICIWQKYNDTMFILIYPFPPAAKPKTPYISKIGYFPLECVPIQIECLINQDREFSFNHQIDLRKFSSGKLCFCWV